ncbi:MAG: hypothetical protein ABIJ96_06425 [Elusimicrobiota bacterium]
MNRAVFAALILVMSLPAQAAFKRTATTRSKSGKVARAKSDLKTHGTLSSADSAANLGTQILETVIGTLLSSPDDLDSDGAPQSIDDAFFDSENMRLKAPSSLNKAAISAGYTRIRVWTQLKTDFQSPSFSRISWQARPKTAGTGFQVAIHSLDYNLGGVDMVFGRVWDTYKTNEIVAGGVYVREIVATDIYWLGFDIKAGRWFYIKLNASGYLWKLDTHVETNAPAYTYSGVTGTRIFGALQAGVGFETHWKHPLTGYVEGSAGFTSRSTPIIESAIGHVSAGLQYRF